ncbi:MAG: hypothetical protein COB04_18570 [Gammaproteobacteria bacterium]|nr:MAG: hypothetical protein COB04_18570 [Gammaproteobacteria bacterium]
MNTTLAFLQSQTTINEHDAKALLNIANFKTFSKEQIIFHPGAICNEVFLMTRGLVRCHYLLGDKEVNLRLLSDYSAVIALSSYIDRVESIETVQAIEDCEGFVFKRKDLDVLAESVPAIMALHLHTVSKHYTSMERRLLTIQHKSIEERYKYFQQHMEAKIVERTPAIHVASYLGVPPESLSRVKRALNKG